MFERYTERARRVIFFARYEASQFGSTTIETEHLLLGLIREDKNLMNRFLPDSSSTESIRKEIEGRATIREKVSTSIDLPLSNECKRIVAYAAEEAERLSHWHIGAEHLLLGILHEDKCVAAEILREHGLQLDVVREEVARSGGDYRMSLEPPEGRPVSESSDPLALSESLDAALRDLIEKAREIVGETCLVFLWRRNKLLHLACATSNPRGQLTMILESLLAMETQVRTRLQEVVDSDEALFIADLSQMEIPPDLHLLTTRLDVKSLVAIPIKKDADRYGVLVILRSASRPFAPSDLNAAVGLAHAMAVIIGQNLAIAQLQQQSHGDALTGLYNQRFMKEILAGQVARAERRRKPLAMLVMDVDDFKRVNDVHGHVTGNEVLKSLATILRASVRREDFVFRCGGDEFAVVLPDTDRNGGLRVSAHIKSNVEAAALLPSARLTVSVGVVEYEAGLGVELFLKRADETLYRDKRGGDDDWLSPVPK
jgi:diguanylate cyclase (GGDEF)-like protein